MSPELPEFFDPTPGGQNAYLIAAKGIKGWGDPLCWCAFHSFG